MAHALRRIESKFTYGYIIGALCLITDSLLMGILAGRLTNADPLTWWSVGAGFPTGAVATIIMMLVSAFGCIVLDKVICIFPFRFEPVIIKFLHFILWPFVVAAFVLPDLMCAGIVAVAPKVQLLEILFFFVSGVIFIGIYNGHPIVNTTDILRLGPKWRASLRRPC